MWEDDDNPEVAKRPQEPAQRLFQAVFLRNLRRSSRFVPLAVAALVATQIALPVLGPACEDEPLLPAILAFAHVDTALQEGELWRLMSSWVIHRGAWHAFGNVLFLLVFGRLIEACFGAPRTWLIACGSGMAGALLAWNAHSPILVGASGAILGMCAAILAVGLRMWPRLTGPLRTALVYGPGVFLALRLVFDLLGADGQQVNAHAHLGGALGGVLLGALFSPQWSTGEPTETPPRNLLVFVTAGATLFMMVAAVGAGLRELHRPLQFARLHATSVDVAGRELALPSGVPLGLWNGGTCTGEAMDVNWALRTGRTVCFPLSPMGMLLLDRRDRLLTLDTNDWAALRAADQSGRFVQSEPRVMVYPLGEHLMWLLLAPDLLLMPHARSLIAVLPPPGSASVRLPPLSGRPFLTWELVLALADMGEGAATVDLGDGVQWRSGPRAALADAHGRDEVPLAVAGRRGQFTRSQPGVALYPLPADRVAVLVGPDARLDAFAERLAPILPTPATLSAPSIGAWVDWLLGPVHPPSPATTTGE